MNRIKLKISRRALLAVSGLLAASMATAGNAAGNAGAASTGTGNTATLNIGIGDAGSVDTAAREIPIGRYRSAELRADAHQVDLLSVIITREFSEQVKTVGQAVAALLEGSGYRLLSDDLADPYRAGLFALPLPDAHRRWGPLTLRQALELLSGPAFRLVIEPTYRLISFQWVPPITTSENDDRINH